MNTENQEENIENAETPNTKYIALNKNIIHKPPHLVNLSKKLLRIEYPGMVENVDKMIETLGGISTIEMAVGNQNRRLELRFRPDDIFSKPCWGDKDFSQGLLVKIKVRQPKVKSAEASSSKKPDINMEELTTYQYEAIGVTSMTFKFTRLCDFQYLPLIPKKQNETSDTKCFNVYEDIMPNTLPEIDWLHSKESVAMPMFFPPPLFAKFNTSKENKLFDARYKYYEKVMPAVAERLKKETLKKKEEFRNVIERNRSIRKVNSIFVNINAKDVVIPKEPSKEALESIEKKGVNQYHVEKLRQLFNERPIWSKAALLHKSGIRDDRIKVILPSLAYYFPTGPWRIMWCKFGYDPLTDPNSRIYQTFDFRIRSSEGSKVKVQAKRSYSSNLMHYRAGPTVTEKFSLKNCTEPVKTKTKTPVDETAYTLKPKVLPPARQMFYQYCDLQLPEIQGMLQRLPPVSKDAKCHLKNGWLPDGFHDQCREIANKYVAVEVQKLLREDKKKKDQEFAALESIEPETEMQQSPEPSLESPIVIDSDDENKKSDNEQLEGDDSTDSDRDNNQKDNEDDDIDMEAVEEINKIISNMSTSENEANKEAKEDSEEEIDPELANLYKQLIVSNTEQDKV